MLRGEYESMLLLHSITPENFVKPIAWGTCASAGSFFLYQLLP